MSSEKDVLGENKVKVAVMLERAGMALEDGEWDKAIQLCEEVLNLDPKNAQAYLDEALAQAQCSSLCDFFEKRLQETERVSSEAFPVKADKEHVTAMVTKYSIPAYVSAEAIESLYVFSYSSCVAGRKEQYQKEEESWNNHKLFARAEKFAEGTAKEGIVQEKKAFFDALQKRIQEAQVKEAEEKMQVETSKDTLVKEADNKAKAMYEQGMVTKQLSLRAKKKKRIIIIAAASVLALALVMLAMQVVVPAAKYNNAKKLLTDGQYQAAIIEFKELGSYKDSEAIVERLRIKQAKVGDCVNYGTYPQTASGTDATPIEWIVIGKNGNKALLLSLYGLDVQPYDEGVRYGAQWETCSLRTWLNETFMSKAFSEAEQKGILTTDLSTVDSEEYSGWYTGDGVFLLSVSEAIEILGITDNTDARVYPTEYVIAQGVHEEDGKCGWWLRSPIKKEKGTVPEVYVYGGIGHDIADRQINQGGLNWCVRPAIWVDASAVSFD